MAMAGCEVPEGTKGRRLEASAVRVAGADGTLMRSPPRCQHTHSVQLLRTQSGNEEQ